MCFPEPARALRSSASFKFGDISRASQALSFHEDSSPLADSERMVHTVLLRQKNNVVPVELKNKKEYQAPASRNSIPRRSHDTTIDGRSGVLRQGELQSGHGKLAPQKRSTNSDSKEGSDPSATTRGRDIDGARAATPDIM